MAAQRHVLASRDVIRLRGKTLRKFPAPIHVHWQQAAAQKGYGILARVQDRYHLLLQCIVCQSRTVSALYTVMTAQPECSVCKTRRSKTTAISAGLRFLRRDPMDGHYSYYMVRSCGHQVRRQNGLIDRAACGGPQVRCGICHATREAAEATALGWRLVGPDPEGNKSYRLYQHEGLCGHPQRIARGNMQSARFSCEACGGIWSGEPSYLYLMKFVLPSGETVIKLGFSKNPLSRLRYQLCRNPLPQSALLRVVAMPTGRQALIKEQAMHSQLRRMFPKAVVPKARYSVWLRVKSEIYTNAIETAVHEMLDAIAAAQTPS